jgi:hypothetical protein
MAERMVKLGRNQPCPCGSGKKYKLCCLAKDEEQARREAGPLVPPPALPYRGIRPEPISPEVQAAQERWVRFESAQSLEERVAIFREALATGSLGSEDASEMLSEIREEATEPEEHAAFVQLLGAFRAQAPELYQVDVGDYHTWLIEDALERQAFEALPPLLEPFGHAPDRYLDHLFALIPLLMYHGQGRLLLDLLRRGWPTVKRSKTLMPWAIAEYRQGLMALVLFDYVASAPAPRTDDPALAGALDGICEVDERVRANVSSLLGQGLEPLRLADFLSPRDNETLAASLHRLTVEWLGELHRRHGVSLARGELARRALLRYLHRRAEERASGRQLLLPAAEPLWRHLYAQLTSDEPGATYAVSCLLELLPRYVDWLVARCFVASPDARHALRGLGAVQQSLLRNLEEDLGDRAALRALERAGRVVREAIPIEAGDDPTARAPLFAQLCQAGQHPEPVLLDAIKALGSDAVPPLVAMATDERLHFAEQDDPEVWAPLHAVRLLGELAAAEAVEPLLPLFGWDDDWLATALPEAYGRIGRPALEPLRALLRDREWDLYARARAASGLVKIAEYHPALRSEAVGALEAQLGPAETVTTDDATLSGFIISDLLDIKALEALPAMRRAFEEDRVDPSIVDYQYVEEELGLAPARPRSPLAIPALPPPERAARKIDRNEPCPCGSGKKYKRCCGG